MRHAATTSGKVTASFEYSVLCPPLSLVRLAKLYCANKILPKLTVQSIMTRRNKLNDQLVVSG